MSPSGPLRESAEFQVAGRSRIAVTVTCSAPLRGPRGEHSTQLASLTPHDSPLGFFFLVRKLRLREGKSSALGHTASKRGTRT